MPGSSGPMSWRKIASPPTEMVSREAPWNESHIDSVLNRPVAMRASLSAIPTAAAPPGANSTLPSEPGASPVSFLASSMAGMFVYRRVQNGRVSICSRMARTTRGCPKPTWCTLLP